MPESSPSKADSEYKKPSTGYDSWLMTELTRINGEMGVLRGEMKHVATKDDLSRLRNWVLGSALGVIGAIVGTALWMIRPLANDIIKAILSFTQNTPN